ncbi:MAG: 5'-3' exonuclease H3TH domain-containing protein, partial [Pyrinomonadaceae bacterium]
DKDLAQCVVGERVVQVDHRSGQIRDAEAIRAKYGVAPSGIPDYLALVGDAADGYPGIAGYGPKTAAQLINRYGRLEDFPLEVFKDTNLESALLFKKLATLRIDAPLFNDVEQLRWKGATASFESVCEKIDDARLATRVLDLEKRLRE